MGADEKALALAENLEYGGDGIGGRGANSVSRRGSGRIRRVGIAGSRSRLRAWYHAGLLRYWLLNLIGTRSRISGCG
jgi:hypothetical protein